MGSLTENEAQAYLIGQGYRILGHNLNIASVQVDFLARDPGGLRTIIEVKSSGAIKFGFLSDRQSRRLKRVQLLLSAQEPTALLLLAKEDEGGFLEIPIED